MRKSVNVKGEFEEQVHIYTIGNDEMNLLIEMN